MMKPQDIIEGETRAWVVLRDYLMKEHSLPEDDQALLDTLEGEGKLPELIQSLLLEHRLQEAYASSAKALAVETKLRAERHEAKAEKLKQIAFHAMLNASMTRLPDNGKVTASISQGRPELHYDEDAILAEDIYVRVKREVDKQRIRDRYERGEGLPKGVTLGNAKPRLNVRFK